MMARRTVYCSTTANGEYSICTEFDNEEGNILFPDNEHTFNERGRCEHCGANEANYERGADMENYAYSFIHDNMKEVFKDMKFDVIIGNPPYQLSDGGGTSGSAIPLYNKFIEKAIEMNPKYISMIIPSRWMKGGRGLSQFRKDMISDLRIKTIVDFEDTSFIFPSQGFDGGVNYFLWDRDYEGMTNYKYRSKKGEIIESTRFIKNKFDDKVIRDIRQLTIIEKAFNISSEMFDALVSSQSPFGFRSDLLNNPEKYSVTLSSTKEEGRSLVHGLMGGQKRAYKYIETDKINKNKDSINKYKLFFSKAFNLRMTVPPKIIVGEPGTLCTETFLKIGDFNTEEEMLNCLSYIKTKFFRALFYYNRHSLNISQSSFALIPLQDWSKPWTDEELYKKYKLNDDEIAYIEDNIDPMYDQVNPVDLEVDLVDSELENDWDREEGKINNLFDTEISKKMIEEAKAFRTEHNL